MQRLPRNSGSAGRRGARAASDHWHPKSQIRLGGHRQDHDQSAPSRTPGLPPLRVEARSKQYRHPDRSAHASPHESSGRSVLDSFWPYAHNPGCKSVFAMGVVVDDNNSSAAGHGSNHSPLSWASIDRPPRAPSFEHLLDLCLGEIPFIGSSGSVNCPCETPESGSPA